MEQGRMATVEEAVEIARQKLEGIRIPAGMIREIGIPVSDAANLLRMVQEAWARDAAEKAAKEREAEDGGIEITAEEEDGHVG